MAQLTITFDPVAGASSYEVCYKASTDSVFTCVNTVLPSVTITTGIECETVYDVTVKTICSPGNESFLSSRTSNQIVCPQDTWCYFVSINSEDAIENFIEYTTALGQIVKTAVNTLILNSEGYYQGTFCSTILPKLVNSTSVVIPFTQNSHISGGTVSCGNSTSCKETLYVSSGVGIGGDACFVLDKTVYSNCNPAGPNFGAGCILYTDNVGTTTLAQTPALINGVLYNINVSSGAIIGVAETQCG